MLIYDSKRIAVSIGKLLASRGEGAVHEVDDPRNLVAKVYHKPTPERAEKLTAMIGVKNDRLLRLAAWPVDTLRSSNGQVVGFLMPKVAHAAEIHELCGLKSRQKTFPQADWRFLIQAAANTARAFHVLHEHGHVIGDVNHGNLLVSPQATVTLIDCDSFQVHVNGRAYLCPVGVDTHTPPELQGVSFNKTPRTPNHDTFGLAILIFQLLFTGRHPFSGTPLDAGDMPIDKAIREGRFAYGSDAQQRRMRQPPNTLDLSNVTPRVVSLFERAFLQRGTAGQMRPTAAEWIVGLDELRTCLRPCASNSQHYHLNSAVSCPWCQLEKAAGLTFFLPVQNVTPIAEALLSLEAVWARIIAVAAPTPAPPLPLPPQLSASAEYAALAAKRSNWLSKMVHGVAVAKARSDAAQRLATQKSRWTHIEQQWHRDQGYEEFRRLKSVLADLRADYLALNTERDKKLQVLQNNSKQQQLKRHLESIVIRPGIISGIGPSKVAALQSYGIDTAEDISSHKVFDVPGFGPNLTQRMVDWRGQMGRSFRYDPSKGIDPRDIGAVDAEINRQRANLLDRMRSNLAQLSQIPSQIQARRAGLQATVQHVLTTMAQAEADLNVLS